MDEPGGSKLIALGRRADADRGGAKMGIAPILLISGLISLAISVGNTTPDEATWLWWSGTAAWWVKFGIGAISVCGAGAFWSGGRWERAAAALRDELDR